MKKKFTKVFLISTALLLTGIFNKTFSQQTVDIGPTSGSSSYYYGPYYRSSSSSSFDYSRYAYLYTASELNIPPGSVITEIAWLKASGTISGNNTFDIWLENNSATSLSSTSWSTLISSATQVYASTTQSFTAANDSYETFPLTNPFLYTGGALEIITNHEMNGSPSGANDYYYETVTGKAIGIAASSQSGTNTVGSSSSYNNKRPTIRITYMSQAGNNAGISELTAPLNFCAGNEAIKVIVKNSGVNIIDSVKVAWELDGVAQTPYSVTTALDTFGGAGSTEIEITLGNYTFTGAPVALKAWTYLPNGVADTSNANDTLTATLHASLSGTYTINSANPTAGSNYQSFADFTNDLNTYGICGPVTANVVAGSGPYVTTLSFGDITGASATNTIRINGNGETVQFTNTSTERQLLTLDGAKYLTIDSLNFKSLSTSYGWGALITNGSAYDSIMHCEFDLSSITGSSSANSNGICFSGSATSATSSGDNGSNCYIGYNQVIGGTGSGGPYYGMTMYGTSGDNMGNVIAHNTIQNFYYYGIYTYYGNPQVLYNDVNRSTKTSVTTCYMTYFYYPEAGSGIIGNRFHNPYGGTGSSTSTFYGLRVYYGQGTTANPIVVANNTVYNINQGGTVYGMYVYNSKNTLVYHNTVTLDQALSSSSTNYGLYAYSTSASTYPGLEIKNNIVSITQGGTGTKYGFYYSSYINNIQDIQKNNFYVNSTQAGSQYYGYASGTYTTQAAFQAAYPTLEVGSPSVDPQFVNAATGNLTPGTSILVGAGENLTTVVPEDINGNIRPITPTIGAFEVVPVGLNNAGAIEFIAPLGNYCEGQHAVSMSIKNAGINNITSLQIGWQVNGVLQTPYNYSGTLTPLTSSGASVDTVTIGNATIPSSGPVVIKAWTTLPNGSVDTINSNDTTAQSFQATTFTIAAASDTICAGSDVSLSMLPNTDIYDDIMWQFGPGTSWSNLANSDTTDYTATNVANDTWFRARMGQNGNYCYTDSVKVTAIDVSVLSTTDSFRCDPGTVVLGASANPGVTLKWYDSATSTTVIDTGAYFTTPVLTTTTNYWVAGSLSGGGGNGIRITEAALNGPDGLEIQNVGSGPVDVTGWKVAVSNSYSSITSVNSTIQTLSGTMNPGDIKYWTDASGSNYWGSNLLWNPGDWGWIIIIDDNDELVDFFVWEIPIATVQGATLNIGGANVSLATAWTGVTPSSAPSGTSSYQRTGSSDNDMATDFGVATSTFGTTNTGLTLPFSGLGGGCESPRQMVTATVSNTPVVNLGNDSAICEGTYVILDAGNPGTNYEWNNNSTNQTLTTTLGGTYYVTVTNAYGCWASDTVSLTQYPNPIVNLGPDQEVCQGTTITLDAGNPGENFLWNTSETTQTIDIVSGGNYFVTVTDEHLCTGSDTIEITANQAPEVYGITAVEQPDGSYHYTAANPEHVLHYFWDFGDGDTSNEDNPDHSYTQTGNYLITLIVSNGCGSDTVTTLLHHEATGINALSLQKQLKVFPNPAKDLLTIKNESSYKMNEITVYNVLGQAVFHAKPEDNHQYRLNLTGYASGIYTLRVKLKDTDVISKFEVIK